MWNILPWYHNFLTSQICFSCLYNRKSWFLYGQKLLRWRRIYVNHVRSLLNIKIFTVNQKRYLDHAHGSKEPFCSMHRIHFPCELCPCIWWHSKIKCFSFLKYPRMFSSTNIFICKAFLNFPFCSLILQFYLFSLIMIYAGIEGDQGVRTTNEA